MFTINHTSNEYSLNLRTVPELREALAVAYPNLRLNQHKKSELVDLALVVAANERAKHEKEQAAAAKCKQERIEFEKTLPNSAKACQMIAEALEGEANEAEAVKAKFLAKAADDPADAIRWMAEDVFLATQTIRDFLGWANTFNEQAKEPTRTIDEVQEMIEKAAKQHTNSALECSMYPTNAMQSLEQVAKYKVHAKLAKVFSRAAEAYKQVAESTDDKALFDLNHLRWCL